MPTSAINTVNVTKYLVTGRLEDAGPQPFRMAGTIDYRRGYALHHISVTRDSNSGDRQLFHQLAGCAYPWRHRTEYGHAHVGI